MVNLTGELGRGLQESVRTFQSPPDRVPDLHRAVVGSHHRTRVRAMAGRRTGPRQGGRRARRQGAEDAGSVPAGTGDRRDRCWPIDDPRFDPMWDACGALGLPVAIHISDPEAFFLPIDRFNERYEELGTRTPTGRSTARTTRRTPS